MTDITKKIIGSFVVTTKNGDRRTVVVSQKNIAIYNKNDRFKGKFFNLDGLDGPEVFETKDSKVFELFDGTKLFQRGIVQ